MTIRIKKVRIKRATIDHQPPRLSRNRLRARGLVPFLLAAAVVAALAVGAANLVGCAMGIGGGTPAGTPDAKLSPTVTAAVDVYMLSGEQLVPVARTIAAGRDPAVEAVRALLGGPTGQERAASIDTAIPDGSSLESAAVDGDTAIFVFNDVFAGGGQDAGSASGAGDYHARLAQVAFTATAVPGISRVEVSAPGERTLYLTRSDFSGPSASSPAPTPTLTGGAGAGSSSGTPTPVLSETGAPSDPAAASPPVSPAVSASPTPAKSASSQAASPSATPVASPAAAATPPANAETASRGPRIDPKDAKAVQTKLVRLRYLPWKAVTGTFDYRTSQAVMAFQSWEGLTRDGVVGKQTAGALAKAKPPRPTHKGKGRSVEVHRGKATVLVVQDGRTLRAVHTSTGQTGDDPPYDTPAGSYAIYAKQLKSWSVPYKVWMPYAMYFNGGIAMHGSDSMPPYPASHGCVRLPQVEAPVVYGLVSTGTPVYVY